jgi:hypothetical protein
LTSGRDAGRVPDDSVVRAVPPAVPSAESSRGSASGPPPVWPETPLVLMAVRREVGPLTAQLSALVAELRGH